MTQNLSSFQYHGNCEPHGGWGMCRVCEYVILEERLDEEERAEEEGTGEQVEEEEEEEGGRRG
ncbi:hypothetical protein ACRRTK_019188 [Alexandromys fortis]